MTCSGKPPLLVNLFAGPGAGKSTMAARVFADLKTAGVRVELVTEFAKDLTWEGRGKALRCQPFVFGEQLWRIERLMGVGLSVIITDSPLLLSNVYWPGAPRSFQMFVRETHRGFRRLDVVVRAVREYDPVGRGQTEGEARSLDTVILGELQMAGDRDRCLITVEGNLKGASEVSRHVCSLVGLNEPQRA